MKNRFDKQKIRQEMKKPAMKRDETANEKRGSAVALRGKPMRRAGKAMN